MSQANPPAISVVIPCCGQLEYTRLCVSSLLRHSRTPYELVFVDLDSVDGTAEFLAGIVEAASVPIHVLRLSGNAGFSNTEKQLHGLPFASQYVPGFVPSVAGAIVELLRQV